jgi:calcineurin-like phosphoesterase family protein
MWFFTADLHLGHSNIIKHCKRPFMSREEQDLLQLVNRGTIPEKDLRISIESTKLMTDTVIDSINAVVGPDDHLVIVGDFCWTPKFNRFETARAYRNRINCRNLYLIWGNHDDQILRPLFKNCWDQYLFNVDGQNIFTSHYPCRSWDKAYYGSWMLYGHVHNFFGPEDSGNLQPYEKNVLEEGFKSVLSRYSVQPNDLDSITGELLGVCSSLKGIDYTLDVGVDNDVRGPGVSFGAPWSIYEIRSYMDKKKSRWEARSSRA